MDLQCWVVFGHDSHNGHNLFSSSACPARETVHPVRLSSLGRHHMQSNVTQLNMWTSLMACPDITQICTDKSCQVYHVHIIALAY